MSNVCQIQMSMKNFQLEENEIVKMGKKRLLHKWQYLIKTGNVGQARLPCFRNVFILKQNIVVIPFLCLSLYYYGWKNKFANTKLFSLSQKAVNTDELFECSVKIVYSASIFSVSTFLLDTVFAHEEAAKPLPSWSLNSSRGNRYYSPKLYQLMYLVRMLWRKIWE